MKKKVYQKPLLMSEDFVPQEYVAACWGVGCDVETANAYEQSHFAGGETTWWDLGCSHASGHCGSSANQVIRDSNNDGRGDEMVEVKTDGLGTLPCTIYSDATYNYMRSVSEVKIGDIIYWTTAAGTKVWHHVGTVFASVPGRPNMS
ncbi:MAG: hypothetical protein MR448_02880 [Parabacteroides sp.]|nr:hypothetical protein [Parabacteroides sp.]